jgi:hypothetical protein
MVEPITRGPEKIFQGLHAAHGPDVVQAWIRQIYSELNLRALLSVAVGLLGWDAVWACRWVLVFWRNVLEAVSASEILVSFYQTAWLYIPEDSQVILTLFAIVT